MIQSCISSCDYFMCSSYSSFVLRRSNISSRSITPSDTIFSLGIKIMVRQFSKLSAGRRLKKKVSPTLLGNISYLSHKKHLPSVYYKFVYNAYRSTSLLKRDILINKIKRFADDYASPLQSPAIGVKLGERPNNQKRYNVFQSLPIPPQSNPEGLSLVRYNIDKLFLKSKKGASLRLWKSKRKWVWKYLRRIHLTKKLSRTYGRMSHWSFARLNHSYVYDIFIFWFALFFKKFENFSHSFFFQLWLNIYFSQVLLPLVRVTSFVSRYDLPIISFFSFYSNISNSRTGILSVKKLCLNNLLSYYKPAGFTKYFKLISLFWSRYKLKHPVLEIASWRWKRKFKYNNKLNSYARKKRRKMKTRYFFSKKSLRLRFRKQHGYGLVFDYFLCSQLKRFKRVSLFFSNAFPGLKRDQFNWYDFNNSYPRGKYIVGAAVGNPSNVGLYNRLRYKRIKFIDSLIDYKKSQLGMPGMTFPRRKKLIKHINLLEKIRKNFIKFNQFISFWKSIYFLVRKKIITLRNPAKLIKNVQRYKSCISSTRYDPYKRLRCLYDSRFVFKLFAQLIFGFFDYPLARKHFARFKELVIFRIDIWASRRNIGLSSLDSKIIRLGINFLAGLVGKRFLENYIQGKSAKNSSKELKTSHVLMFFKKRLLSLKKQASLKAKGKVKFNRFFKTSAYVQKAHHHKMLYYPQSSFGVLYNKLVDKKLILKSFRNLKFRNKNRKRRAKVNRRKLLVISNFKKIVWKSNGNPIYLSHVEK